MNSREWKEIQPEGLPVLAQGVHGTVYQLDGKRVVKLYTDKIPREQVEKEWLLSREVRSLGVPSAETGELVRCRNRYGIVFERMEGDTLGHVMAAEPERIPHYARQHALLAKKLHQTRTGKAVIPKLKEELGKSLPLLAPYCTEADLGLLEELIDCIPESDSLIHGDLHPGNIMLQKGALMLIDLPEIMRGSPQWDLAAVYRDMIIGPMFPTAALEESIGMRAELITRAGGAFFQAYTGLEGERLQRYMDSLLPLYGMNTIFNLAAAQDRDGEACERIIPMLMREAVRKHEDQLREMLAENTKEITGDGGSNLL